MSLTDRSQTLCTHISRNTTGQTISAQWFVRSYLCVCPRLPSILHICNLFIFGLYFLATMAAISIENAHIFQSFSPYMCVYFKVFHGQRANLTLAQLTICCISCRYVDVFIDCAGRLFIDMCSLLCSIVIAPEWKSHVRMSLWAVCAAALEAMPGNVCRHNVDVSLITHTGRK